MWATWGPNSWQLQRWGPLCTTVSAGGIASNYLVLEATDKYGKLLKRTLMLAFYATCSDRKSRPGWHVSSCILRAMSHAHQGDKIYIHLCGRRLLPCRLVNCRLGALDTFASQAVGAGNYAALGSMFKQVCYPPCSAC